MSVVAATTRSIVAGAVCALGMEAPGCAHAAARRAAATVENVRFSMGKS
jgi:hypothetical protein